MMSYSPPPGVLSFFLQQCVREQGRADMTASEHINDVPLPDSLVEAHDPASSQLPSSPTVPSPLNSSETSSAQSDPIDIPDIRVLVGTCRFLVYQ